MGGKGGLWLESQCFHHGNWQGSLRKAFSPLYSCACVSRFVRQRVLTYSTLHIRFRYSVKTGWMDGWEEGNYFMLSLRFWGQNN